MKANDRGKRPDNLTLVIIAMAAACVVLLVVVVVLGVRYLGSRDSDDATPTVAGLATSEPTQEPTETPVPVETPSGCGVDASYQLVGIASLLHVRERTPVDRILGRVE